MRKAFLKALFELAETNSHLFLVTGDLGFGVLEDFEEKFPNQYINAGVSEQAMTGIAAGLALSGATVFTYSIGNFPTLRCLEQVRNDICYHNANVKIVTVGGGLSYGSLGYTHHAVEDIAIMRALPNIMVLSPGDPVEVQDLTQKIAGLKQPVYFRIGRAGEPICHSSPIDLEIGKPLQLREGHDVALLATGSMLHGALESAEQLQQSGIDAAVFSCHTLKPFQADVIHKLSSGLSAIVTIEEHSIIGGLGAIVSEFLGEIPNHSTRLLRLALPPSPIKVAGSQEYLRKVNGLSPRHITQRTIELLRP